MKRFLSRFATYENRWYALIFIALGLAIVIIDNTILNVSMPYMLRDLNTTLPNLEWAISGYSLTMAAVLITVGRVGDLLGRKRLFVFGMIIFAAGSFLGSISRHVELLIAGRAIVQALGAAAVLTSALALIAAGFQGRERGIAFGIWGAVAGSAATVGPLLGGYLTTYYSWRWSFRVNIFIAAVAIAGSILIRPSRGEERKGFDWVGTALSASGLFSLVFGFVKGKRYGWFHPNQPFRLFGAAWPLQEVSVIPFAFALAAVLLTLFVRAESRLERAGGTPLFRLSMFGSRGFSLGMATLLILAFGQFGIFFVMPIYLENVLGLNAFQTGLFLLPVSISLFLLGLLSGFLAGRINVKWVVAAGMVILAGGAFLLRPLITVDATVLSMAPGLIVFGVGFGLSGSQMNNIILSSVDTAVAGEASAGSITMRQVGASIGVAVIGAVLATTLTANVRGEVGGSPAIPPPVQQQIISQLSNVDVETGQGPRVEARLPPAVARAVKEEVDEALASSAQATTLVAFFFIAGGAVLSLFIPPLGGGDRGRRR